MVVTDSGNIVVYCNSRRIWHTNIENGEEVLFQASGNLVIYRRDKSGILWQSSTRHEGVTKLVIADNGNLLLLGVNNKIVWSSQAKCPKRTRG